MSASKTQSQKIFEKLKTKPANKVRSELEPLSLGSDCTCLTLEWEFRPVSTATLKAQHGRPFHLGYTFVSTAARTTVIWVCTSHL